MRTIGFFILCSFLLMNSGCYDDYQIDFDYSSTYFPIQKPLRTLIYDADNVSFQVGVVLAGRRENNNEERIAFSTNPALLNQDAKDAMLASPGMEIMPSSYYSIELQNNDSVMVIPKGSFQGLVRVVLNQNFINDPNAILGNYVIPFQIISSTTDSILTSKNYTLIAVKYINQFHGWYYQKGQERKIDPQTGSVISTFVYSNRDIIDHRALLLSTTGARSLNVPATGRLLNNVGITVNENNTVGFTTVPNNPVVEGLSSSYSPTDKRFFLNYNYILQDTTYAVFDTLYYRNTELFYESW